MISGYGPPWLYCRRSGWQLGGMAAGCHFASLLTSCRSAAVMQLRKSIGPTSPSWIVSQPVQDCMVVYPSPLLAPLLCRVQHPPLTCPMQTACMRSGEMHPESIHLLPLWRTLSWAAAQCSSTPRPQPQPRCADLCIDLRRTPASSLGPSRSQEAQPQVLASTPLDGCTCRLHSC